MLHFTRLFFTGSHKRNAVSWRGKNYTTLRWKKPKMKSLPVKEINGEWWRWI